MSTTEDAKTEYVTNEDPAKDGESWRRLLVEYFSRGYNLARSHRWVSVVVCIAAILAAVLINTNNSSNPGGGTTKNQPKQSAEDSRGTSEAKPIPAVGYALAGYNIIKGNPLSIGHDPGFTYPIFKTEYSGGYQSDDFRFNIPNGLVIFHDISCKTSFSSSTIESTSDLSKAWSSLVNVEVGIPVFGFKASTHYKRTSSSLTNGMSVYILSTVNCEYYYSKLKVTQFPDFSSDFIYWMNILNKSNEKADYMSFFDYFGTHFFKQVTFGANYVNEHKISSHSYKHLLSKGIDIDASASYSGEFSLGGGYAMSTYAKNAVSEFSKLVTTETYTKGAPPPANGDAMTWASTIKDDPVPIKYTLSPIANLFTAEHMASLNVNYDKMSRNIKRFSDDYCKYLQEKGLIHSCGYESEQIVIKSTRLWIHDKKKEVQYFSDCLYECMETTNCFAVSFWKKKLSKKPPGKIICYLFTKESMKGTFDEEWETTLFRQITNISIAVHDTAIRGIFIDGSMARAGSKDECLERCKNDKYCSALSYCACPDKRHNCGLFASNHISHFFQENGTTSYISLDPFEKVTEV